ncbi:nitrate- and nitrite sensing domain-containing protein, partial [Nonomuraea lactucae]|uniref:sensor histidine kinase n=1 Tax=Nonomuraea lactucae TaxID=2249762 RepID=UPI0013B41702
MRIFGRRGITVPRANPRHRAAAASTGDRRSGLGPRTIRGKLSILLAIPTAILIGLAGVGVLAQYGAAQDATATTGNVELVLATQELVHSLQRERGLTNGMLGGESRYRDEVDTQRARSNVTRSALDRLLADETLPAASRVRAALDRLSGLAAVRGSVDAGQAVRTDVFAFYTAAVNALGEAAHDEVTGQSQPALRRGLEALRVLGRAKEAMARERGLLNGVFATGSFTTREYVEFSELRATRTDALAQFVRQATPGQVTALNAAQRSPAATKAAALELRAIAGVTARRLNVDAATWWDAMTTQVDAMHDVQRRVGEDIGLTAREGRDDARTLLWALLALAGLTVLGAIGLGLVTSRSIVRPLRLLAGEANEVAERRLPETVARIQATDDPGDVVTDTGSVLASRRDEFAEVATALANVHRTAIRLAAEQAVLRRNTAESLANLGRRNQNLVRRQLGFISALEREETDPGALANLFELDHLATRMRRNAESLLVLVGEQSPRRSVAPVPVGDVLRSALSEVEDYRRVVLRKVDDAMVRGAVVAEVAHLLAELIENALVFSPPDQDVEIQARIGSGQYDIAIIDNGVGMSPEEIQAANARLRGERSFLVAPTRYLGHYVVGRLAQRLGIDVWLHDSPLTGVTVRVVMPRDLLVEKTAPRPEPVGAVAVPVTAPIDMGRPRPLDAPGGAARANGQAPRPPAQPPQRPQMPQTPQTAQTPQRQRTQTPQTQAHRPQTLQAPRDVATTQGGLVRRVPRSRRVEAAPVPFAAP